MNYRGECGREGVGRMEWSEEGGNGTTVIALSINIFLKEDCLGVELTNFSKTSQPLIEIKFSLVEAGWWLSSVKVSEWKKYSHQQWHQNSFLTNANVNVHRFSISSFSSFDPAPQICASARWRNKYPQCLVTLVSAIWTITLSDVGSQSQRLTEIRHWGQTHHWSTPHSSFCVWRQEADYKLLLCKTSRKWSSLSTGLVVRNLRRWVELTSMEEWNAKSITPSLLFSFMGRGFCFVLFCLFAFVVVVFNYQEPLIFIIFRERGKERE